MRMIPALFLGLFGVSAALAQSNIADSLHNLSVSGPGQFKSRTEDRICIFCHTPHSDAPDVPMWNRRVGISLNYKRRLADGVLGKPGTSSVLCLSCHDGTIALGDMLSNQGKKRGRADDLRGTFLTGRSNLGTDLSNDHPISIAMDSNPKWVGSTLVNSANVDLPLANGEVQCTSCHDPHDDATPPFLHRTTLNGELCTTCHLLSGRNWDWASSAHALSTASPKGVDPWPKRKPAWRGRNVAENACMNCHAPHNAATGAKLVNDLEEQSCFRCHDGSVAKGNVRAQQQKFFRHPVEQTPNMDHSGSRQENPLSMRLHVECEDCHNPHASSNDAPMISFNPTNPLGSDHSRAPLVNGRLAGVSGIDIGGGFRPEAQYEYEVCFKCHGVPGKSACGNRRCSTATGYNMSRQDRTYNLRDKFDPGNSRLVSYHPIDSNDPSNNSEVPSLRKDVPLSQISSRIYCSDCHSSDDSPAAGGSGAAGPHGSRYEGLMALRYEFNPQSAFGQSSGGLCLKCHDLGSLYGDDSFPHRLHVLKQGASCINCHDPHGSAVYPHLINFLTQANVAGRKFEITGTGMFTEPTWEDRGRYSGTCYLNCHGTVHDGLEY